MTGRKLAAAALFIAAALAAVPTGSSALPLGRTTSIDVNDKAPAQQLPQTMPAGDSLIHRDASVRQDDKATPGEPTPYVLIRAEFGTSAQLVGEIYLILVDADIILVAAIAATPTLCAIPACGELPPETVAETADRARLSIIRQHESGRGTISGGGADKSKGKAVAEDSRHDDDKSGEFHLPPADEMNPASPWWSEWLSPTTVIGLTGTLIAGLTGWFAIAHQRYQMRLAQAAAAAASPVGAGLSSKPRPRTKRRRTPAAGGESGTPSSA